MFKGHCDGCPHEALCFEYGDCQKELTRQRLGVTEYAELSEVAPVSALDPDGDEPILIHNPLEKDDEDQAE